ncbi:MAG: FAD-binding oxidoreductase [Deltaproteobacteria bacterium]|nr:FAD-binding oxidoreductase [Deltaproteobacteria bacterium]
MTMRRDQLRWNGWGRLGESMGLSPARERWLLDELGRRLEHRFSTPPALVSLDQIRLAPCKIAVEIQSALRAACGDAGFSTSALERVTHAAGRSLPDLLRLRRGELVYAPDAVAYPASEGAVASVLRIAADANLAVIPFGGGSSVVGGVEARTLRGQAGALCLDTTRLDALVRIDRDSLTATFQAGIDGPALEAALRPHGLSLGHFPQSFEFSTLGGWIATRSSGQSSSGYGAIEDMLVAVRVVTPEGVIRTLPAPRSAAGPDLNALVLGSEGTLGVVVEATLRVHDAPAVLEDRGMLFRSFSDGAAAVRDATREGVHVAVMRLSDTAETELARTLRRDPERRFDPAEIALGLLARMGYGEGRTALVYAIEAESRRKAAPALRRMLSIGRRHGGVPLGRAPGRAWRRDRFRTPYLREWLLDHGIAVDTFETAFSWSRLEHGHDAVLRAMRRAAELHAGSGVAMAHLSHSYTDGGCLYFTLLYPLDHGNEIVQWEAIKREVTEAIVAAGGTLSHHHGVGVDHQPWLAREKGALGLAALRAARTALDPRGLMNPEKLL